MGLRNGKVGVSTIGAIKKAGGTVVANPTPKSPYHAILSGINPATAEKLFAPSLIPNPCKTKSYELWKEAAMSDAQMKKIRVRCEAARSGPWTAIVEGRDQTSGSSFIMIGEGAYRMEDLYLVGEDEPVPSADYDFIAHARQDIPFLLDEIDRLKKQLAAKS